MQVLSDDEWTRLKAARSGTGRSFPDERRTVEAVIWRRQKGAKWRALPAALGPWRKAAQLHIRWSRSGVWQRAFEHLRQAGRPDLGEVFLDGTRGGRGPTPSGARAAATASRLARRAMGKVARSPSP